MNLQECIDIDEPVFSINSANQPTLPEGMYSIILDLIWIPIGILEEFQKISAFICFFQLGLNKISLLQKYIHITLQILTWIHRQAVVPMTSPKAQYIY